MGTSAPVTAKSRRNRLLGTALGLATALVFTACSAPAGGGGTSPSGDASGLAGFIESGVEMTYIIDPPNVFQEDNGDITGASAEAIKAILAELGITKLNYTNVPFDSTIPTLSSKRGDLTSFIFNIKPDRCEQVAFTNPIYIDRDGAMVLKGNPKDIHSWDDLVNDESIQIASIRGDAHLDWLASYGIPESRIQQFESLPQAVEAVETGRADVYLNGMVNLAGGLVQGGDAVEIAEPFDGPVIDGQEQVSIGGFATSYDNIELLNEINRVIAEMIISGELADIIDPLGYPASGVPDPTMTAKSICPDAPWPADYVDLAAN